MSRTLTPHQYRQALGKQIAGCYTNNNTSLLEKANQSDPLEKGGEGSRGGKIIGHTKSGKAIYDNSTSDMHKNFTKDDHLDAAQLHREKMAESIGKQDGSHGSHMIHRDLHKDLAKKKEAESLGELGKTKSGKTVYDKFEHPGHKDFTATDHADASYMHMNAVANKDTDHTATYHDEQSASHYRALRKINAADTIGTTVSGKDIHTDFNNADHEDFTADDHIDAVNAHTNERDKERRNISAKHGEDKKSAVAEMNSSDKISHHDDQRQKHLDAYSKLVGVKKD